MIDYKDWRKQIHTIKNKKQFGQAQPVDSFCSQIIQKAMQEAILAGQLTPSEVVDFAESLVFDERVETCYAYDPRDALKRRL